MFSYNTFNIFNIFNSYNNWSVSSDVRRFVRLMSNQFKSFQLDKKFQGHLNVNYVINVT